MDPLSALSVAASAVQFIDFATNLLSGTMEIYRSAEGAQSATRDLKSIIRHFKELNDSLLLSSSDPEGGKDLQQLCLDCSKVAEQLLSALNKISVEGKATLWKSFIVALKSVWSHDEIEVLERRLDMFRRQISMQIIVSLRYTSL